MNKTLRKCMIYPVMLIFTCTCKGISMELHLSMYTSAHLCVHACMHARMCTCSFQVFLVLYKMCYW